jgi:hypothetical protein
MSKNSKNSMTTSKKLFLSKIEYLAHNGKLWAKKETDTRLVFADSIMEATDMHKKELHDRNEGFPMTIESINVSAALGQD